MTDHDQEARLRGEQPGLRPISTQAWMQSLRIWTERLREATAEIRRLDSLLEKVVIQHREALTLMTDDQLRDLYARAPGQFPEMLENQPPAG